MNVPGETKKRCERDAKMEPYGPETIWSTQKRSEYFLPFNLSKELDLNTYNF
jgi:hypothetical protein